MEIDIQSKRRLRVGRRRGLGGSRGYKRHSTDERIDGGSSERAAEK